MISLITESTTEQTFVRFGKRFKHGKSINYLAMNPRIKDIYSERLAELQYGYISEEEFNEWCEEVLEDDVWYYCCDVPAGSKGKTYEVWIQEDMLEHI